jgi:hypothetical protein
MNLDFVDSCFRKNHQILSFTKIRPEVAELYHANGQTDMIKLVVPLRNFEKAPKNDTKQNSLFWRSSLLLRRCNHFAYVTTGTLHSGLVRVMNEDKKSKPT